jgi:chromosome segregation ATPase
MDLGDRVGDCYFVVVVALGVQEGPMMRILTVERVLLAAVVMVASLAWTGRAGAQAQTSPDVLPALLTEVRGLRAAMEQMASAGPRIQLFTSRLQLQEARITNLLRRLDTVREALATAQGEAGRMQTAHKQLEAAIAAHRSNPSPEAREEGKHAEMMLEETTRAAATARANVDRLTAEEAQLLTDITAEQGRWTDINARLDELEKLLVRR